MNSINEVGIQLVTAHHSCYLHSFDEFKHRMESDNEFHNKVVTELNKDE